MAEELGYTSETYTPDNLIAGNVHHLVTEGGTLITGQNLERGALVGKITASGKYTLSLTASSDGSEDPVAILAVNTDATSEDLLTSFYLAGEFNEEKVTFGTAHDADSVRAALRDLNIHLKPPVQDI